MIRIGVDFGGTKIEAAALDASGAIVARLREPTPGDYPAALAAIQALVRRTEADAGAAQAIGFAIPGSLSPADGRVRNANTTWLNGRPFRQDLERTLGRPVRIANDANCFALSEASDGAGAGARTVFGVIVGTGCGGGVVIDGQLLQGANGIAGEWGHTPLPWPDAAEHPGPACWCGRRGCLETWISGTAFEEDFARTTGKSLSARLIVTAARGGDGDARAALDRYVDRLARGLAVIADVLDPDVVVLGGGMSNVDELYAELPPLLARRMFSDLCLTRIERARHGDSSGVRGAAWLWPTESRT